MYRTLSLLGLLAGAAAWSAPHGRLPASQPRCASPHANFFAKAQELVAYKLKHVSTMATVQHVLVPTFEKLNEVEAEVLAAGSTSEAMAAAAKQHSACASANQWDGTDTPAGTVGPFMLGQKDEAFERVCFEGEEGKLLPCRSKDGYHLIKIVKRGAVRTRRAQQPSASRAAPPRDRLTRASRPTVPVRARLRRSCTEGSMTRLAAVRSLQ